MRSQAGLIKSSNQNSRLDKAGQNLYQEDDLEFEGGSFSKKFFPAGAKNHSKLEQLLDIHNLLRCVIDHKNFLACLLSDDQKVLLSRNQGIDINFTDNIDTIMDVIYKDTKEFMLGDNVS